MSLEANEDRLPEMREKLLKRLEEVETKADLTALLAEYPEVFALVRYGINAISVTGVKIDLSHYLIHSLTNSCVTSHESFVTRHMTQVLKKSS